MTSFDTSPQLNVWRALAALAVVFVMLATTGWTAVRSHRTPSPLQASLSAWEHGRIGGLALPDPDETPGRLARFFASLTDGQRDRLVRRYPLAVGNMNGAPVGLRYRANRVALHTAREADRVRVHDNRLSPVGQYEAGRRMHRYDALLKTGRQILAFDPEGSGRVAEVFGDLDTARRVSVVVPGVDTDLLTFQRTNRKYSAPVGMAKALYRAEWEANPTTRTAVIAWADYTAPSGVGMDAATAMRANSGALRLNALVRALPGRAKVALFCHSYGSVLCGVAAHALPPRVTDIAVAGSPGMRVENSAGAAHLRPGVGDARRRRLDPGRAAPGGRRARTRRRSGVVGVRRPRAVRAGRAGARRLFRAGYGESGQLRRDRRRRLRRRAVRSAGSERSAGPRG
ncbi:hypothetical protein QFZ49_001144 [Streptomyces turgidiscabies]|uniref:DUF1023 domain-containing protein n=1 Tax=Streptomyces turgidiscabies TaxID=85558 RepID=A0ABU0RGY0_9ACTN|nr:hypothetical protein [Streptomyces turgidiscabies]